MVDFLALLGLRAKPGQSVDPAVAKRLKEVAKPKTEEQLRIEASMRHAEQIRETAKPKLGTPIGPLTGGRPPEGGG